MPGPTARPPPLAAFRDELLADASRDTRVHTWIASQYSFALEEAALENEVSFAARRDSKLLPDELTPLSPSYDPLFCTDPALAESSPAEAARAESERELALEFLVRQMNTWRVVSNREKALPATPPSSPSTPTLADFPSPPTTTPSSPSTTNFNLPLAPFTPPTSPMTPTFPATPSPARRRPSMPLLSTSPSTSFSSTISSTSPSTPTTPTTFFPEPDVHPLTSSASYASLRQRAHQHRFPSISTTLSTSSAVRNAIYLTPVSPSAAPQTPTPTPPHGRSEVYLPEDNNYLSVYPGGHNAEASRWSVATSAHSRTPVPPVPSIPESVKDNKPSPSIRKRLLSTLGIKSPRRTPKEDADDIDPAASTHHLLFPPTIDYPAASRRVSWAGRRRATSGASHVKERTGRPDKRLVVTGLRDGDMRAEEAVRLWCESFGELRRIVRRDGALHISFRKASVADRVCRIQAQVSIRGAGSVGLSWVSEPRMF